MPPSVPFEDKDQALPHIHVGAIANVHGVKGLVKLLMRTEDYAIGENVAYFTTEDGSETLSITLKSNHGKYVLAEIEGVNTREAAEDMKGTPLYLPREDGMVYDDDLIGQEVFDEDSTVIGTILSLDNFGASDLLEIKPASGGESFYVPYTEEYVKTEEDNQIIVREYHVFLA